MTNLRQLHGDVWNGVRFFLTVNGILLAGVVGLLKLNEGGNWTAPAWSLFLVSLDEVYAL
jgi:hypothetical protein